MQKMTVDLKSLRQQGEAAQPKTPVRGSVNATEQSGSGGSAGIVLVLLFSGAAAAFFGGLLNLDKDNIGGPTKHTPADLSQLATVQQNMS